MIEQGRHYEFAFAAVNERRSYNSILGTKEERGVGPVGAFDWRNYPRAGKSEME